MAFFADTFTDTSGTTLASRAGWTLHPSYVGFTAVISNANRLRAGPESGTTAYYASGTPASADYDVEGTVRQISDGGFMALLGRVDTASDTFYMARYNAGATNAHQLYKNVSGTFTQLGSNYSEVLANGDERLLKLQMRGTAIKMYVDGVLRIDPPADSAISAAGRVGIRCNGIGSDSTLVHLNDITATDTAAGTVVGAGLTRSLKLNRLRLVA